MKSIFFDSFGSPKTVSKIIDNNATIDGDKTAAVGMQGEVITYSELKLKSDIVAQRLVSDGVKKGDVVAVYSYRSINDIVSVLGIWKAGAAYVMLETSTPEKTNDWIIQECKCGVVIDSKYFNSIDFNVEKFEYDNNSSMDAIALISYTSGSTTKPKGVIVSQKNVWFSSETNISEFGYTSDDVYVAFANFNFIVFIQEVIYPLCVGGTIHIISKDVRRDGDGMIDFFVNRGITIASIPASIFPLMQKYENNRTKIRKAVVGSAALYEVKPAHYEIIHVYASTELTMTVASSRIIGHCSNPPIGKIKDGLKGYLVDESNCIVPDGAIGELWVSGPQVTRGYLNLDKETAEHYINNPFSNDPEYAIAFRTNDLMKCVNGNLYFVSRKDFTYKINGFRVDSGSVELAMHECCPQIEDVVVKAFVDKNCRDVLCAFVTSDMKLDVKDIHKKLSEVLPYYCVPMCIIQIDDFPRNANGKIVRSQINPPDNLENHKLLRNYY